MDLGELLTTSQVAARRGVAVRTITRWVARGWLRPVAKLPGPTGAYLFDPEAVEAAFEAREPVG